jgi:hypothetical protein
MNSLDAHKPQLFMVTCVCSCWLCSPLKFTEFWQPTSCDHDSSPWMNECHLNHLFFWPTTKFPTQVLTSPSRPFPLLLWWTNRIVPTWWWTWHFHPLTKNANECMKWVVYLQATLSFASFVSLTSHVKGLEKFPKYNWRAPYMYAHP